MPPVQHPATSRAAAGEPPTGLTAAGASSVAASSRPPGEPQLKSALAAALQPLLLQPVYEGLRAALVEGAASGHRPGLGELGGKTELKSRYDILAEL